MSTPTGSRTSAESPVKAPTLAQPVVAVNLFLTQIVLKVFSLEKTRIKKPGGIRTSVLVA